MTTAYLIETAPTGETATIACNVHCLDAYYEWREGVCGYRAELVRSDDPRISEDVALRHVEVFGPVQAALAESLLAACVAGRAEAVAS